MVLRIGVTGGKFGAILQSEMPYVDVNASNIYITEFEGYGWKLALRGNILTYERVASSYGPEVASQRLFLGDIDGTIYLKTKRRAAHVHFAAGDLSLELWRTFGIDEVRFANPNRAYARMFTTDQSVKCRMRGIFCDGLRGMIGRKPMSGMYGGEQLSMFSEDADRTEVHDSSWALVNALYGIGTMKPRTYWLLYALPPEELKTRLEQYQWIKCTLSKYLKDREVHGFSSLL